MCAKLTCQIIKLDKTFTEVEIKHKPGLNCSAVILVIQIPTPSINANKMAPTAADLTAADGPPSDNKKIVSFGDFP